MGSGGGGVCVCVCVGGGGGGVGQATAQSSSPSANHYFENIVSMTSPTTLLRPLNLHPVPYDFQQINDLR